MQSDHIVSLSSSFDFLHRFVQIQEPVRRQAIITKLPIERSNIRIIRQGEVQHHLVSHRPIGPTPFNSLLLSTCSRSGTQPSTCSKTHLFWKSVRSQMTSLIINASFSAYLHDTSPVRWQNFFQHPEPYCSGISRNSPPRPRWTQLLY